jgi:hypothetical protein
MKPPGSYGKVTWNRQHRLVHRVVYELLVGPIQHTLDHVRARGCIAKHCCNPAHLEYVSLRENILRDHRVIVPQTTRTHCPQGHPYSGDNLKIGRDGKRYCRECHRADGRRAYARKTAGAL